MCEALHGALKLAFILLSYTPRHTSGNQVLRRHAGCVVNLCVQAQSELQSDWRPNLEA